MSKWVIENVELIKKTYVVEAYGEPAAILAAKAQAPNKVETIGELAFDVTPINEYEYNKYYTEKTHQEDRVLDSEDAGHVVGQVEEDHSNASWHSRTGGGGFGPIFGDPDLGPDQLKIFDEEPVLTDISKD